MTDTRADRHIFAAFADMLDYPAPGLAETVRRCEALVAERQPAAADLLAEFRSFVEATPAGMLEEVYAGTFDLGASCHPFVGYHLFGETYQRSAFLVGLRESYAPHGFSTGTELPDHLAVMLRFLAICDDGALTDELVRLTMLPALKQMIEDADKLEGEDQESLDLRAERQIYRRVLAALQMTLRDWHSSKIARPARVAVAEENAIPG